MIQTLLSYSNIQEQNKSYVTDNYRGYLAYGASNNINIVFTAQPSEFM